MYKCPERSLGSEGVNLAVIPMVILDVIISNTGKSVSSDIQTLRRGLKKQRVAEFF